VDSDFLLLLLLLLHFFLPPLLPLLLYHYYYCNNYYHYPSPPLLLLLTYGMAYPPPYPFPKTPQGGLPRDDGSQLDEMVRKGKDTEETEDDA